MKRREACSKNFKQRTVQIIEGATSGRGALQALLAIKIRRSRGVLSGQSEEGLDVGCLGISPP